jgi:hypothetical protein
MSCKNNVQYNDFWCCAAFVQLLLFRVLFGSFSMGSDQLMLSEGMVRFR